MPKVVGLKLTDAELASWTDQADSEGLTLTKWIRKKVNQPSDDSKPVTGKPATAHITAISNPERNAKPREFSE